MRNISIVVSVFVAICLCCVATQFLNAADVYYIDFDHGVDTADGLSQQSAWKHAPGDKQATDSAAATSLQAGDRVLFKGGVRYRGSLTQSWSGSKTAPIVYDGNRAGIYGTGPAIIDGSEPLMNWQQCTSAKEAGGNPDWKNIYYTDIKDPGSWRALSLCGPQMHLPIAQSPNPTDPMFQEAVKDFFFECENKIHNNLPLSLRKGLGTQLNKNRPLVHVVTAKRGSAIIGPIGKGAIWVTLDHERSIEEVGIAIQKKYQSIDEVHFFADKKLIHTAHLAVENGPMQRFKLDAPVTAKEFGFQIISAHKPVKQTYAAVKRVAAWNAEGENILEVSATDQGMSFTDVENLTASDPLYYDDMTFCFHGGHNAAVYTEIKGFDPGTHTLSLEMQHTNIYKTTRYALLNSVKLIDVKGEYAIRSLGDGRARVYVMPPQMENKQPVGISYSVRPEGFRFDGASHIRIGGFKIERQGGRKADGISIKNGADVCISDCEITMVRGFTGIAASHVDGMRVEDCFIHHLPGHTKGLVFHTCTDCHTIRTRFVKTTSTSLDYYNCHGGTVSQCEVSGHKGMHANGLTFYVGCKDLVIDRNLVYDGNVSLTIQEAENIIIKNNIFDGNGGMGVGLWTAVPFKNISIIHNIIINSDKESTWATGLFSNNKKPEGLVVKNNIIDGLSGNLPGQFSHNIYTRLGPKQKASELGVGCLLISDLKDVLVDPDNGDYRLRAGSPAINAATDLGVTKDFNGNERLPKQSDIGPYEWK